jgi:hypothetical protein
MATTNQTQIGEIMKITRKLFKDATGRSPIEDDLERCNCPKAGQSGHYHCGWNYTQNMPVFMVGGNDEDRKPPIKP